MSLFENFKQLIAGKLPDSKLLVPLLIWSSGNRKNIDNAQAVNKLFFFVDNDVLTRKLTLNNKCSHVFKYPKSNKVDPKLDFFLNDICDYFGYTRGELEKNMGVFNLDELKPIIADAFGYEKKERRILKIK